MRCAERLGVLLAGLALTAQSAPARQALPGHYAIPHAFTAPLQRQPGNEVRNPGFESGAVDGGWYQCGDVAAYVLKAHAHGGLYDEYSGTTSGGEPAGNSGVCQRVTIPPGGMLSAWLYQLSDEADTAVAYQEADLLDNRGRIVVNLYRSVNHAAAWVHGTWNLAGYAGRSLWVYFGVHGDGYPKLSTQQYVDDVVLTGSPSPSPAPK
ncbi:MAG TPA: hypothetical protein VGX91_09640 [Candidatus Cybelea sp.]|nr:hypothetical protein [Candidatus Cybelea sp.]